MADIPVNVPALTDAEVTTIRTSVAAIRAILQPKFINLDAAARQRYGSVNEKNKGVINKVKDYNDNQPELSSPRVDWAAFDTHHATRSNYEAVENMMAQITELCQDPRTMVDFVLYNMARQDYRNTQFMAAEPGTSPGYEAKERELSQFFKRDTDDDDNGGEEPGGGTGGGTDE